MLMNSLQKNSFCLKYISGSRGDRRRLHGMMLVHGMPSKPEVKQFLLLPNN